MKELLSFQLSAAARSEATRAPWFREGGAMGGAKPAVRGPDGEWQLGGMGDNGVASMIG